MILLSNKEKTTYLLQWYLLGLLFLYSVISTFFFEQIPVGEGLGWDGTTYYKLAADFKQQFISGDITRYYLKRSLPPAFIHYFLKTIDFAWKLLGGNPIAPTIPVVINGFLFCNILAILGSNFFLFRIYDKLEFGKQIQVFCFIAFNLIFPISKLLTYYPILTDHYAVFISVLLLYAYLYEKTNLLFLTFLIAYFTFPTLIIVSFILFAFPYTKTEQITKIVINKQYNLFIYIIGVGLFISYLVYNAYIIFEQFKTKYNYILPFAQSPIDTFLFPLSICLLIGYVIFIAIISYPLDIIQNFIKSIDIKKFIFILVFTVILSQVIKLHFKDEGFSQDVFLENIVTQSIKQPLVSFFCHYFYFGIAYLIPFMFYRYWNSLVKPLGIGAILVIFAHFVLMIGSETRQFIPVLPFLVLSSGILLQKHSELTPKILWVVGGISLLLSTIWLPINYFKNLDALEMPYMYAIHQGPWMPPEFYYILVCFTLFSIGILNFLLKKNTNTKEI